MDMFLVLLFTVLITLVSSYNLDFEYSVAKTGPSNSLFGFSVAEHRNSRKNENWILVGAPKANNSGLISKYQASGTVFKCRPDDPAAECTEEVVFDNDVSRDDLNKSNEWLGVSLKSGGPYNDVVTCAHRYESYGSGVTHRLLEGECYQIGERLKGRINTFGPCNTENVGGGTSDHTTYGQCQSGIGLDILPKEYTKEDEEPFLLIGAAGTKWWSGEFFQTDTEKDFESKGELPQDIQDDIDLNEKGNKLEYRSSYFGYAVTYGNFFRADVALVASGGPRHKHYGKVLIYERVSKTKNNIIQELPNNETEQIQIASGYGIALCSIDSDNNGIAELIVGAPFYLSLEGKERPEQGIVYVYSKSDDAEKLVKKGTVQGEDKSYSRFGYAVANGGDLNLDKYNDLIVGAPREDEGNGAVYVFYGSKNGVTQRHRQRIAAADIHSGLTDSIGLKGFGRSLGTGVDMDDNGYNDILVGAYLSNQVALLRSRPVIAVASRLEFSPQQLDAGSGKCDLSKVSICTQVKLCFNISEPSGKLKTKNKAVAVKYTIEADPIRGSVRKSRMKFDDNGSNKKSFTGKSTVGQYKCQELGSVSLIFNTDGSIIEYPDIKFKVSYNIPYNDPAFVKPTRTDAEVVSLDDYPALQQNMDGTDNQVSMTTQLMFKRNCTTCIPDLELSSRENIHTLRLGKQNYAFDISIKNIGQDLAYSVSLEIKLPKTLTLNDMKIKGKNVGCRKDTNICPNMITRLKKGEIRTVTINLETGDFASNFDPAGENNITIVATSANGEKPGTTANNRLALIFDLKVSADLRLHTIQSKTLNYEGEVKGESAMRSFEDIGPYVIHKYVVTNDGPDMLEMANLTIDWPYQTRTGKHLLYFIELEGIESMADVKCVPAKMNVLNLNSDGSSISTAASHVPKSQSAPVKSDTVVSSKRVRRAAEPNEGGERPEVAAATKERGILLNCTSAQCMAIKCTFTNMEMNAQRTIAVKSVLWRPSLLLDYSGKEVTIESHGKVVIGKNASYIKDPKPHNQEQRLFNVVIPVIPPKRKEKIAVWQIALAVAAGVILLGLMIFGLYKVGFFRRTRTFDESNGANEKLIKGGRN